MTETALQRKIVKAIKQRWPEAWVYHPADHIRKGIPDLLICLKGQFIAIEVKLPGLGKKSQPTALQRHTLEKIRDAGGAVMVATTIEDAMWVLDCHRERRIR